MKTWKVLDDDIEERDYYEEIELLCECGHWAHVPTKGRSGDMVIAVIGLGVVFDNPGHIPPADWLPNTIQCRRCGRTFGSEGGE